MKLHWKVLLSMLAGLLCGLALPKFAPSQTSSGLELNGEGTSAVVVSVGEPANRSLRVGDRIVAAIRFKGDARRETRVAVTHPDQLELLLQQTEAGEIIRFVLEGGEERLVSLVLDPASPLARAIAPLSFIANIFMALLKMLIVPLVLTSIISGVAGVGSLGNLRRLGTRTFLYYIATSMLAIVVGQVLVTLFHPGEGATLGLTGIDPQQLAPNESFIAVLVRMVPANVVAALGDNGAMLQVIFFALLFGYFITQTEQPHQDRNRDLFESLFHTMLRMAEGILTLLPIGVFCLIARVVAQTGFGVFRPLIAYMLLVTLALLIHSAITLPLILRFVAKMSPLSWFRAMSPALITAFSTSSSSVTLPVSLRTVEHRGRVSNRVTSFTLPLGATINMDGTALYECVGVIFLAQYYASTGTFELTLAKQGVVVMMALLASIGAAGIPSAGLVMMLSILAAIGLPLEGAALLLAIDRPLDMLRTVVNVWSDSCCAAVIARGEGETDLLQPIE